MKAITKSPVLLSTLCAGVALGMTITTGLHSLRMAEHKQTITEPVVQVQPTASSLSTEPRRPTMWDTPKGITPVFDDGNLVIYEEPQNTLVLYRDDEEQLALTYETGNEAINVARKGGSIVTTSAPVVFTNL